jgi:hypothetical protein
MSKENMSKCGKHHKIQTITGKAFFWMQIQYQIVPTPPPSPHMVDVLSHV